VLKEWKLLLHLLFLTKHFGVNNEWWSSFSSVGGISIRKRVWNIVRIYPVIRQYKWMKYRAIHLGGLHPSTVDTLWPLP
jgi:hypothetical protein